MILPDRASIARTGEEKQSERSPQHQPDEIILPGPSMRRPAPGEPGSTVTGDLLSLLRSGYRILTIATLLGLIAAYLYTGSQVPRYRSTATLEIQDLNENFMNREMSQVSPFTQTSVANDMQTQLRILQSGTLISRTLNSLPLEIEPPTPGLAGVISRLLFKKPSAPDSPDTLMENAASNLQVRETRQARIVDVTYESSDANYSAAFANSLVQHYTDQSIEARLQISKGTSEWLQNQLADAGAKMAASEAALQNYARQSGLLVTTEQKRPDEEKFRQIQENFTKAQENRMMKQARMETAAAAPIESLDVPLGSALREYQAKLSELRRQRADLMTVYTPDFEGVKRLDSQIGSLASAQRFESNAILQAIKNDYTDALKRERLLQASYQDQFLKVTEQSGIAIQYGILKRAVDTNRDLYNTLLQRTAEAKIAAALRASGARVVDPARTPRLPFKPSRILNLLWGATAGMLMGLLIVTIRSNTHPSGSQGARELATHLGLPELGAVPKITMVGTANAAQRWGVEAGFVRIPGQDPSAADGVAMMTWNNRASREANSFRSILTSILLSRQTARTPQMIVVTSARRGEGKTTVIANLAAALSQMGRTVLLVDASPDRRLHELFQAAREAGLNDVLELPGENSSLLPYVTRETFWNNVSLISTGNQETNALDLLYAPGMAPILMEMRRNYDVILIDTPAIDDHPDARILAKMSDGVVLVVRDGEGRLQAATSASQRLQEDGAIVLGTVLNKAS